MNYYTNKCNGYIHQIHLNERHHLVASLIQETVLIDLDSWSTNNLLVAFEIRP